MTQPSKTYEELERRASEPRRDGPPPQVVHTVVSTKATQRDGTAPHTMEHSKKGRGTLVGILVVPGLVLLMLIAGYWLFNLFIVNSQQQNATQQRPAAETNAPRPETPVTR